MQLTFPSSKSIELSFKIGIAGTAAQPQKVAVVLERGDISLSFNAEKEGDAYRAIIENPGSTFPPGELTVSVNVLLNNRLFVPLRSSATIVDDVVPEPTVEAAPSSYIPPNAAPSTSAGKTTFQKPADPAPSNAAPSSTVTSDPPAKTRDPVGDPPSDTAEEPPTGGGDGAGAPEGGGGGPSSTSGSAEEPAPSDTVDPKADTEGDAPVVGPKNVPTTKKANLLSQAQEAVNKRVTPILKSIEPPRKAISPSFVKKPEVKAEAKVLPPIVIPKRASVPFAHVQAAKPEIKVESVEQFKIKKTRVVFK